MTSTVCSLGIDVGSTTMKIVCLDAAGKQVWHLLEQTEPRAEVQVERMLQYVKQATGMATDTPLVSTGYGRRLVKQADKHVTEISCHVRGVYRELGHGGTLVDIGGQDSKVIRIGTDGKVVDFAMNDKCAAGTGRFLEYTSGRLKVPLEQMGSQALSVTNEAPVSSTCTVFAESEVISLLAHGVAVAPILRGLHRSLVRRIVSLLHTVGLTAPLMLSGGVAQNPAIRQLLAEETGEHAILTEHPQLTGAYGAALYALEMRSIVIS